MASDAVKDALRGHRAERQLGKIAALEVFRDRVVKRPEGAALELDMRRLAELLNRVVNVASRKRFTIHKLNDQGGRLLVRDRQRLVCFDTLPHIVPMGENTTHGVSNHALDVAQDVDSVAASQLDVRREAEIFANHHAVADADGGGKGFVVSVAKAKHDLTIRAIHALASEGKAAEVALTATGERMFLLNDCQADDFKSLANESHKRGVADGLKRFRSFWSFDAHESFEVHLVFCDDKRHIFVFRVWFG